MLCSLTVLCSVAETQTDRARSGSWRQLLLEEVLPEVDVAGGRSFPGQASLEFASACGGEGGYYYNARWYDPTLGRFITEDPARDQANWFIYVGNNPLTHTDPTGLGGPSFFAAYQEWMERENSIAQVGQAYFRGAVSGFVESAVGTWGAVTHPARTAKAAWNAVTHPADTAKAVTQSVTQGWKDFWSADAEGKAAKLGEVGGSNAFFIVTGVGAAKAVDAVSDLAKAAKDLTYLYEKVGAKGEHLKYGVTKDPLARYTQEELAGGDLRILASGSREEMLALERDLHSTLPIGPEERQSVYVKVQADQGLKTPPYKDK